MKLWHCRDCDKEWKTEDSVMVFYHHHPHTRRAQRWIPPEIEGTTIEELWAQIFGGFAGGTPAPPTAEQAIEETARQRQEPRIEETE